jgi:hypothetical protein
VGGQLGGSFSFVEHDERTRGFRSTRLMRCSDGRLPAASHGSLSPSASARHVTRARTTDQDDGEVEKVLRGTSSLLYRIVSDIEAAREDPVARSVEIR